MSFIRAALYVTLCFLLVSSATAQDEEAHIEAATDAAETWIAQIDESAFQSSWESAAPVVQESVSQDQWATMLEQAREQTGELSGRSLQDSQYRTSLPNAPEGEYVVLQYASSFENVPQAGEIVVMMRADDEEWKAAGYRVIPAQQQRQDDVRRP